MAVLERFYGNRLKLNKFFIEVIGFVLGDGTIKNNTVILACNNRQIYNLFNKIKAMNVRYTSLKIYFWKNTNWKHTYFIHIYDKIFIRRFINILENLLRQDFTYSMLFLRGFIHAEGSIIREIKISNSNIYYVRLTEITLRNLKIKYRINVDSRRDFKHKRDYYYVRIYGEEAQKLYTLLNLLK